MKRRAKLLLLVLVGVTATGSFGALEFGVARSDVRDSGRVDLAAVNRSNANLSGEVRLVVRGDDRLHAALERRLAGTLRGRGVGVTRVDDRKRRYAGPVLAVTVTRRRVGYNPLTPSATLTARFEFSSTGNTSYFEEEEHNGTASVPTGQNAFLIDGRVRTTDSTRGLVSYPAYLERLGRAVADGVAERFLVGYGIRDGSGSANTAAASAERATGGRPPALRRLAVRGPPCCRGARARSAA